MNKEKIYNECVNKLQEFEGHNSSFDQLLEDDADNDLEYAIYILKLIMIRTINDLYEEEREELNFYSDILYRISEICIY